MTVISIENLSKFYRLGQIGTGTFSNDLKLWWARMRGQPNPLLRIGESDQGNCDGERIWALKNVSFNVQRGEVLGIIGRNGAGKSTLLKILSRVTAPTSGRIHIRGRVASLLEVGTGFHPELTGRENIYLNGAILGMNRQEVARKFDEIVDFSGVEKFIDTPVKRYSSGMHVRLGFAVAAHLEPEILVVDEVLAVGDAEFQKKCLGKMGDVARGGRTVLFVSHNMGAIQALCNRAIVLNFGSVYFQGDLGTAISQYLSLFDSSRLTDLKERVDRVGNGWARFHDAYFLDANGRKVHEVMADRDLTLVLKVNTALESLDNVTVITTIYDQSGYAITHFNNTLSGYRLDLRNGDNEICCTFHGFPFRPGFYSMNIYLGKDGDTFDHLERALRFELLDSNFFGTGHIHASNIAPLLIRHSWYAKELESDAS